VDHVEKYRLPKHLLEKEDAIRTDPGHAYDGQELASEFRLDQGQDLFARPAPKEDAEKRSSKDEGKEAKRKRKEEREQKRRTKEKRREEKEERKRERRAKKYRETSDSGEPRRKKHRKKHGRSRSGSGTD
jgi:hypothetical protein